MSLEVLTAEQRREIQELKNEIKELQQEKTKREQENYDAREAKRQLKAELEATQAQLEEIKTKLPPEDAIILTGENASTYNAFKELGLTPEQINAYAQLNLSPEEITEALNEKNQLAEKVAQSEYERIIQEAAGDKYKPAALKKLLASDNAQLIAEGEGKNRVYKVRNGDEETLLDDVINNDWADFKPSLMREAISIGKETNPGTDPKPPTDYRDAPQDVVNEQLRQRGIQPTRY